MKRILILLIILLFSVSAVSAALETGLQAPEEFIHSEYWNTNNFMDIYCLSDDNNTRIEIDKYDADADKILFESDGDYHVTDLGNNTYMGIDNSVQEGYVLEVIDFNGQKYLVTTGLYGKTDDQVRDSMKYLAEFNQLNGLEPVAV